jgi:hypothetical protein
MIAIIKTIGRYADELVLFAASSPFFGLVALILAVFAVWLLAIFAFVKFVYVILTDRKKLEVTGIVLGSGAALVSIVGFIFGVQSLPQLFGLLR